MHSQQSNTTISRLLDRLLDNTISHKKRIQTNNKTKKGNKIVKISKLHPQSLYFFFSLFSLYLCLALIFIHILFYFFFLLLLLFSIILHPSKKKKKNNINKHLFCYIKIHPIKKKLKSLCEHRQQEDEKEKY